VQDHWTAEDWRLHRWAYARLVERADAEIGTVLDALRQSGLEGDTVVVFTSDHGEMDASHKLEHKSMPYEEATRVPFIVSHKGVTPAGRVDTTDLVSTGLDLIPTLCDLAGIATPAVLKGRSVKPLVMGGERGEGRGERGPLDAPSRQKASVPLSAWRQCLVGENEGCRMVWTRRFMYAVYDHGQPREFLADLEHDPGEMVNLAVDPNYAAILSAHRDLLRAWYPAHGETLDPRYIVR
jgi:arylsulfatase A-like enzyme